MKTIIDFYGDEYPVIAIYKEEWAVVSELDIKKSLILSLIHIRTRKAANLVIRGEKAVIIEVKKLQPPEIYQKWNNKRFPGFYEQIA